MGKDQKHEDPWEASGAAAAAAVAMRPIPREAIESGGRAGVELAIRIDQERRAEAEATHAGPEAPAGPTSVDSDAWPTPSIGDEVIVTGDVNGGQFRSLVVEGVPDTGDEHALRDRATVAVETRPSYELTMLVDGEVPAGIAAARARRERQHGDG